jgi:cyanophycinase-like exopeptidase
MDLRKPVTLIGGQHRSRHFGTKPYLGEALRLTGKDAPRALYIGAANGDDPAFGAALCAVLAAAGAHEVLWPKLASGRRELAKTRAALAAVDFVFVGGGDVEAGVRVLREADLIADLKAAAARGAVYAGMSAGSIMLGERWIRWPHANAGDDEAETYECLGRRGRRLARDARVRDGAGARARAQGPGLWGAQRRGARRRPRWHNSRVR